MINIHTIVVAILHPFPWHEGEASWCAQKRAHVYRLKGGADRRGPGDCKHVERRGYTQKRVGERWPRRRSGICQYTHLLVEFNFTLKDALQHLKQVCDMVGQKDLFGSNLIGARRDYWGELRGSCCNCPDRKKVTASVKMQKTL